MLTHNQLQWFSFKYCNLKNVVINIPLHNLKKNLHGKFLFYDYFISVMRSRLFSKSKKHSSKRLKHQMMASTITSKCNKPILKAESNDGSPQDNMQCSSSSNNSPCVTSPRGKEEETSTDRTKESIKSSDTNPSKHSSAYFMQQQAVACSSFNWGSWPVVTPPVMNPLVCRSLSDSRMIYLKSAFQNNYNRNRMRRSNTLDPSNRTSAIEREKQLKWNLRTWKPTPYGKKYIKPKKKTSFRFSVMSYNVLAQELLTEHSYLYREHNAKALLWEQRWQNLLQEIQQHDADILCLQEVQASHLEGYFNLLKKMGYEEIFKQRTGVRTDGCAIYYKYSVLNLLEYTTVEFNQMDVPILNRDNVAIIAKFSPKNNTGSEFVVATTHLLYNPKREDVRLAQTQVLLSELDRMSYKKSSEMESSHVPIVMTGDFNLTPNSAVYELITRGFLEYENLPEKSLSRTNTSVTNVMGKSLLPKSLRITDECQHADVLEGRKQKGTLTRQEELKLVQLHHSERSINNKKCSKKLNKALFSTGSLAHYLDLKSAYDHINGDDYEATTYQNEWVTVDYIFYSGTRDEYEFIRDDQLKLLSRYTIPTRHELEGIRIPNYAYGSDHLSLVVKFQLESCC